MPVVHQQGDRIAGPAATLAIQTDAPGPALALERLCGLGQGGLSPRPMWEHHANEVRALRPGIFRVWAQQYFPLDADTPDPTPIVAMLKAVREVRAEPLLSLALKPPAIFPTVDERQVLPADPARWQRFLAMLAERIARAGFPGIRYEYGGEPDCGEGGGCPFLFTEENYPIAYAQAVEGIRRGDPTARVGGPGTGSVQNPMVASLLAHCAAHGTPLDFLSWHCYTSDPDVLAETVTFARGLLARHPGLKPETILDEWAPIWNDDRSVLAGYQACFIPAAIHRLRRAGLDAAAYYHVRDFHVDARDFEPFFSPRGSAFMARWWNRMPQLGGLYDFQDTLRPAFFAFKLLARLTGSELPCVGDDPSVQGFATWDPVFHLRHCLFWNFGPTPRRVQVTWNGLKEDRVLIPLLLDPAARSLDENHQLRPSHLGGDLIVGPADPVCQIDLPPYAVAMWYLRGRDWSIGE